jgi:hypothetical protein
MHHPHGASRADCASRVLRGFGPCPVCGYLHRAAYVARRFGAIAVLALSVAVGRRLVLLKRRVIRHWAEGDSTLEVFTEIATRTDSLGWTTPWAPWAT